MCEQKSIYLLYNYDEGDKKVMYRTRKIVKKEVLEKRKKTSGFNEYLAKKYKMKGIRALKFSEGLDELDMLLGIKRSIDFDDQDKKYLDEEQLKELEKLKKFD